jgi:hypothetical protein
MMHRLRTILFVLALSGSLYKTFFGSSVKCELMAKYIQTEFDKKFGRFATSLVLFSDSSSPAASPAPDPTKHKIVLLRGVVNRRAPPSSENAPKHEIESIQSTPSMALRIDPTYQHQLDSASHVRLETTTTLAVKELE